MTSHRGRLLPHLVSCALLAGSAAAEAAGLATEATIPVAPHAETTPSRGLSAGDWLVRGRIAGLFSIDETSSVDIIGGRINTPDLLIPDVEIAYFLTDHISVAGQIGAVRTSPLIVGSMVGTFEIGTIWSAAAAASLQYHLLPGARFNPYAGVGVSYSHPVSIEPAEGVADFDLRSQTNLMVQVGADYHIAGDWFANAAAKYLVVPEQVYEGGGGKFTDDLDMLFVGAGIGYRF